jgi:pimeloyl-ACP methyl ester carboxylesterase
VKSLVKTVITSAAFGLMLAAGSALAASPPSTASHSPATVVLVHGAFSDGSAWNQVVPLLQAKGLKVVSVQNPLSSLSDDVAATRRVLEAQTGPVVLVGHSWAGMVITEAGEDERVKALVYVAAFAPAEGQSAVDLSKGYSKSEGSNYFVADRGGFVTMTAEGIATQLAQDLPPAQTRLMAVSQGAVRGANFEEKTTHAAWKTRPSWFIVRTQDHMIQPALQQAMARNIGATVVTLPSSHVPQLSHPKAVADAIIAAAFQQGSR